MAHYRRPKKSGKSQAHKPLDHKRQLPRLRRIEGQVRGLQQMIESERDCMDIVHQTNAIIAALRRVQGDMLSDHIASSAESAIARKTSAKEARRIAEELGRIVARMG